VFKLSEQGGCFLGDRRLFWNPINPFYICCTEKKS